MGRVAPRLRRGRDSRLRENDVGRGSTGRRGCAPSVALARRLDSCLRRNDDKGGRAANALRPMGRIPAYAGMTVCPTPAPPGSP